MPVASPSGAGAPKDCASSSARPGVDAAVASPGAAASAATGLPTTARPAATEPAGGSGKPSAGITPTATTDPTSTARPAATPPGTPSATPGMSATAHPPNATGPVPTPRPDGPAASAASASATRSGSPPGPPTTPPAASPSSPPPPPPPSAAEVAVPADQQCADDAGAACAGLRFGDPRLRLARTADTTDTRPGQQVTHTVTVTDSGEAAALFATVRNSIPAGAPLVSGRISQGTYDTLTGIWQTGRIAAGGTATLTLTLRVPDPAAGTVMSARSEFLGSADPAPMIEHVCPDDPGSACAITRVTAP